MDQEEFTELFAQVHLFDWDPAKCERNLRERQLDFDDVRRVFDGPTIIRRSDRKGEVRYMVFGFLDDVEIVVICTIRGNVCWIISRREERGEMKEKSITVVSRDNRRRGRTDIERLRRLTDAEIDASIANDPDWQFDEGDWSEPVLVMPPKKKAISIRIDGDVLDFFKRQGAGYQRRINAVLRAYMREKQKQKKKRA